MVPAVSSYLALRAVPTASRWWDSARARTDAPPAVTALIHGRRRIEVGAEEADDVLAWAATVDGWIDAEPKPLHLHRASD